MICQNCKNSPSKNTWTCPDCGKALPGGVVFITGISGSGVHEKLLEVIKEAQSEGHRHSVKLHDVGTIMHKHAQRNDPGISWDRILDTSPMFLRLLRALSFQEISHEIISDPESIHIIDLHLLFRWKIIPTKGFEPYILREFIPAVRIFINIHEDLLEIQKRLEDTAWGKRECTELLIWRDEELLLSDMFADFCGRIEMYCVAYDEPPSVIERLIWHPDLTKVYLSFPITEILKDDTAKQEIQKFRDRMREFLIVFDPYTCKDYDETYRRQEMEVLRKEVGEITVDRDFRSIDQADAIVVYYPRVVSSKGVDSEMRHAIEMGKSIYLYAPGNLSESPFQPPANQIQNDPEEFIKLLRSELT